MFHFTGEQRRRLQLLEEYDLGPVRRRLLQQEVLSAELVDEALFEFRRYLGLRLLLPMPLLMSSQAVDEVWHTCILFTKLYADVCQTVFGYFLHHNPVSGPEADLSFDAFEEAYRGMYGDLGRLWRSPDGETAESSAGSLTDRLTDFARSLPQEDQDALKWLLKLAGTMPLTPQTFTSPD